MTLNKNQLQTIAYGIGVVLLLSMYIIMFWMAAFPYDEAEHKREEIAEENAKNRLKAIKELQDEYMQERQ